MYLDDRTDESTQLEDGEKADVDFIQHLLAVLRVGHREHVTRRINSTFAKTTHNTVSNEPTLELCRRKTERILAVDYLE
jgi:hypothetical protein